METQLTDILKTFPIFKEINSIKTFINPSDSPKEGEMSLREMTIFEKKIFSLLENYRTKLKELLFETDEIIREIIAVDSDTLKGEPKYQERPKLIERNEREVTRIKMNIKFLENFLTFFIIASQADPRIEVFFRNSYRITYKKKTCESCVDCLSAMYCRYLEAINT